MIAHSTWILVMLSSPYSVLFVGISNVGQRNEPCDVLLLVPQYLVIPEWSGEQEQARQCFRKWGRGRGRERERERERARESVQITCKESSRRSGSVHPQSGSEV